MTLAEMVVLAREENPNRRATAIAEDLGCSRERVRQLLVRAGLATKVSVVLPGSVSPQVDSIEIPDACPRCGGDKYYRADEGQTVDIKCHVCQQLISFKFK